MRVGKMLMRWLLPDIVETRWQVYVCESKENEQAVK